MVIDIMDSFWSANSVKPFPRILKKKLHAKCRGPNYQWISISLFFWDILAFLNLKFWLYIEYSNKQFVSATRLKLLHGSKSLPAFRKQCVDLHMPGNFNFIIFLGVLAPLNFLLLKTKEHVLSFVLTSFQFKVKNYF